MGFRTSDFGFRISGTADSPDRLERPVRLGPRVEVEHADPAFGRGGRIVRPRRAALHPGRQRGDVRVGQLPLLRHLDVAVVADRLDQQALVGFARL